MREMPNIKITMLGASGVGKTCFMVGMYATMQLGVQGFTFTTSDLDVDLDLSDAWDQMVEEQGEERWPNRTVQTTAYAFHFCYGLSKLIEFDWLDYRGGALRSRSSEADVSELLAHLQASSCIFLCVSGEDLKEEIGGRERAIIKNNSIDRMLALLHKLPETVRPAIVIVITKFDTVPAPRKKVMINDITQLFDPLFAKDAGWLTMICPVTLGNNLSSSDGEIAPKNIHLPVTFSVYCAIKDQAARSQESYEAADKRFKESSSSWLKRVFNKGDIRDSERDIATYKEDISEAEKKMKRLVEELIKNPTIYYNGKEVQIES